MVDATSHMGPVRERILAAVRASPGMHTTRLAFLSGLTGNACAHHLRRLERERLLVSVKDGGRRCWFDRRGVAARHGACLLQRAAHRAVALAILSGPGRPLGTVARSLDSASSCVHRRLEALEALGLALRVPEGRSVLWYPAPGLPAALFAPAEPLPEPAAAAGRFGEAPAMARGPAHPGEAHEAPALPRALSRTPGDEAEAGATA